MKALCVAFVLCAVTAGATVVRFAWDYRGKTNVTFNLKRATAVEGPYVTVTNVAWATNLTAMDDVTPGNYFWIVTTVDPFWAESEPSNVCQSPAAPGPVSNLTMSR